MAKTEPGMVRAGTPFLKTVWANLSVAFGNWWVVVGTIVTSIAAFRLYQHLEHIPLSRVIGSVVTTYTTIFHYPVTLVADWLHLQLPDFVKDIVIVYLLMAGALYRTYAVLARATAGPSSNENFMEMAGFFPLFVLGAYVDEPIHVFLKRHFDISVPPFILYIIYFAVAILFTWVMFFTVLVLNDRVYLQAKGDESAPIRVIAYSREILILQILAIVAAVVGISALNTATT